MDALSLNLGNQIFGPGKRTEDGGVRSTAGGFTEALAIYTWPRNYQVTTDARLMLLAFLTAHGRSESISPSRWATWVFSYIVLAFPEMQGLIKAQNELEYSFIPLSRDYITAVVDLGQAAEEFENESDYDQVLQRVPILSHMPELDRTVINFPPDLAATATVPAVYGYVSLLVFLAAKRITERNVSSITERRPQNLIDAYNIPEEASYSLIGEGKMGSQAHTHVNQAWVTHAPVRVAVISEVAKFAGGNTLPQRVVYTLSKMMELAGMQQATFIHTFLLAMPECVEYSCVRPSLNAYYISLREVAAAPSYLQPYYKVIHGDQTRAFHRNSILPLASCALAYAKHTSPSLRNFDLGEGATAAVNLFDAEAARKGHTTLQNLTAKEPNEDPEA